MKKLLATSACLLLSCFVGGAMAAKPAKSTILHCGCSEDGTTMVYEEISISSKSRGHDAHVATSVDSCFVGYDEAGDEMYQDFVRTDSDCQLDGPELGDPIEFCADFEAPPVAGDECGAAMGQ